MNTSEIINIHSILYQAYANAKKELNDYKEFLASKYGDWYDNKASDEEHEKLDTLRISFNDTEEAYDSFDCIEWN